MTTFAEAAAERNAPKDTFAPWTAPDPEISTVHQLRALHACEACERLAPREAMIELAPKVKRGVPGRYIHGYCYAVRHGLAAFRDLPCDGGMSHVTLSEWEALGLGSRRYRAVTERAIKRRGVILSGPYADCVERVNEPGSVLSRTCHRRATTTNDGGKQVCAWHRNGAIFRRAA